VHTMLLFAFWAFDKKPPKFISWAKPVDEQFDTSTEVSAQNVKQKKSWPVNHGEALAVAVSSLAPSKEEQKERILLLGEELLKKRSQENRQYQSWKHSECEKFLSSDIDLPPNVKEQLQAKMTKLAQEFLNNNLIRFYIYVITRNGVHICLSELPTTHVYYNTCYKPIVNSSTTVRL
jgi:hypothetical protein